MPPYSSILIASSAAIIFALGALHGYYTVASNKFSPRDPALEERLRSVSPILTRETTMWKAWVGFNLSHSLGAMLFGAVYGYLALVHLSFLIDSSFLLAVGCFLLLAYLVVGRLYWFRIPFRGIALALVLYAGGAVAALLGR